MALFSSLMLVQYAATYIALAERAERVAQAITSASDCERLGFAVDMDGVKAEGMILLEDAVKTRMRMQQAQDMVTSSVRRDEANINKRAAAVKNKRDMPAYDAWWRGRCRGLVADPLYGKYYSAPTGEKLP